MGENTNRPENEKGRSPLDFDAASAQLGISARTLRYGEQVGIINSERPADYAYRAYTPETMQRIGQIIILWRLRIPLSEVAAVLADPGAQTLLTIAASHYTGPNPEDNAATVLDRFANGGRPTAWRLPGGAPQRPGLRPHGRAARLHPDRPDDPHRGKITAGEDAKRANPPCFFEQSLKKEKMGLDGKGKLW